MGCCLMCCVNYKYYYNSKSNFLSIYSKETFFLLNKKSNNQIIWKDGAHPFLQIPSLSTPRWNIKFWVREHTIHKFPSFTYTIRNVYSQSLMISPHRSFISARLLFQLPLRASPYHRFPFYRNRVNEQLNRE